MHESLDEFEFRLIATELRPLIDIRIELLLNISKMNKQIKTKFCIHIIIDKIYAIVNHCFNGALLTVYLYLLTPNATFQKAGTCLDAQQSMAKQPIKGCVSNHSRTCRKSVSENSE